jgi:CRP-like cAMP-binding protein
MDRPLLRLAPRGASIARALEVPPTAYQFRSFHTPGVFRALTVAELAVLDRFTSAVTVPRGQVVYQRGDSVERLFLLKQGRVRLSQYRSGGIAAQVSILEPGTFFGEMPLVGERMRDASAEATEDCRLCTMNQSDVEHLLLTIPHLAVRVLEIIGRRLATAADLQRDLAYATVAARLASLLLRLASEPDDVIDGISHQEFADILGAYRETITKTLGEFQAAGYLELARRRIRLLDRTRLAALLDQ